MGDMQRRETRERSSSPTSATEVVARLLAEVEAYYGETYNQTQRAVVAAYLVEEVRPDLLSPVYGALVRRVKLYRQPLPLVEHFEEALGIVREARRQHTGLTDPYRRYLPESSEGNAAPGVVSQVIEQLLAGWAARDRKAHTRDELLAAARELKGRA